MNNQTFQPVSETALVNVEYIPNNSYRSDNSKGFEVHKAILEIQKEILTLGGIKLTANMTQNYNYRSISALQAMVTPIMVQHNITCVGSTERSTLTQFFNNKKEVSFKAIVQIRYVFTSTIDGSVFEVVLIGEASDTGDKAMSKATTSAQKNMYNQVFAIPSNDEEKPKQNKQHNGYNDGYYNNRNHGGYQNNKQNQNNKPKHDPNNPAWGVKQNPNAQAPSNTQHGKLASPELKSTIDERLKKWGFNLENTISQIGLNLNTITDEQLRNVFNEIRSTIRANTSAPNH